VEPSPQQQQFNAAMERYNSGRIYKILGAVVSIANLSLQIYLLYRIWPHSIGVFRQTAAIFAAYLITDFLNGLVHLYMDNNDRYDSPAGPLIANFHLHHKIPQYKKRNLFFVYFNESGSKIWLVGYLAAVAVMPEVFAVDSTVMYILVYTGILSSFAEVSHYLCHSSTSATVIFLEKTGLLLSKQHHAKHHLKDNTSYAFLNGFSDPLLDLIAARFYKGYKQNTDLHYAYYVVADTENR
jgi:sterol desaturase/sphingolipid hydroxylase (fatty acid hydroxylase superfamily)